MSDGDTALGRAWRDDAPRELLTRLTELDDRFGGHRGCAPRASGQPSGNNVDTSPRKLFLSRW